MIGFLVGDEILNVGDSKRAQEYARKALTLAQEIAASDSKNSQAQWDLGFAYFHMGSALRLTQPATAAEWYRKSISFTQTLTPRSEAEIHTAIREEALAAVLVRKEQAAERLRLLEHVDALRQNLASSSAPMHRQSRMRLYCKLSNAELAVNDLAKARLYADLSLPFLNGFSPTSPNLHIQADLAMCYETLGNVQRQIALDHSFPAAERQTAEAQARQWYLKSFDVWTEWNRRGASTPESEVERHKVERLLRATAAVKSREIDPVRRQSGRQDSSDRNNPPSAPLIVVGRYTFCPNHPSFGS